MVSPETRGPGCRGAGEGTSPPDGLSLCAVFPLQHQRSIHFQHVQQRQVFRPLLVPGTQLRGPQGAPAGTLPPTGMLRGGFWNLPSLTVSFRIQPLCFTFPLTRCRAALEILDYRTGQLHCLVAELTTNNQGSACPV